MGAVSPIQTPAPAAADRSSVADETLEFIHRTCRSLSTRPHEDRLLHSLVLNMPARFHAVTAILVRAHDDGTLDVAGTYGYPAGTTWPSPFPSAQDWPITHTLHQVEPLVIATPEDVLAQFPLMRERYERPRPFASVRLVSAGMPVGALVVSLDLEELPQDDGVALVRLMESVRDVVGLYVGLLWDVDPDAGQDLSPHRPRAGRRADDAELTPRQLTILHHMADGQSNGQIAFHIGYSESTVRQESMALYRALGVSGRRPAVSAARMRGLLVDD